MRRARAVASLVAVVLALTACVEHPVPVAPLKVQLADIQSHTIRLRLHQVLEIDLGGSSERFTPEIADPRIVSIVERRDLTSGRFEPEVVPLRFGSTQVALIGADPGDTVGFRVTVTP